MKIPASWQPTSSKYVTRVRGPRHKWIIEVRNHAFHDGHRDRHVVCLPPGRLTYELNCAESVTLLGGGHPYRNNSHTISTSNKSKSNDNNSNDTTGNDKTSTTKP